MIGRADVMLLLTGLWRRKGYPVPAGMRPATINGAAGVVMTLDDGVQTMAFEPDETGERIAAVYVMRNPKKLGHVKA